MLVINSATVIAELLRLDLIDDLRLAIVPVLLGGGPAFPDGVDARFDTVGVTALEHGAIDYISAAAERMRPSGRAGPPAEAEQLQACATRAQASPRS